MRLYLLFTPELCLDEPADTLRRALVGGVDVVQWRPVEPDHDELARAVAICRDADVPIIVNDDPALAVAVDADGAHVGQEDVPAAVARDVLGPDRTLGVSTHDLRQLRDAEAGGADYVGFGPCFATETKGYSEGLPLELIEQATAQASVPLFAIGGITAMNLPTLVAAGVRRIAVTASILRAADPAQAAAELRARLVS